MNRRKKQNFSFDSLVPRPIKQGAKYFNITKKNYDHYRPIEGIKGLEKMLANPSNKSLRARLKQCYKRLEKLKLAKTTTTHYSPRQSYYKHEGRYSRRRPQRSLRFKHSRRKPRYKRSHTRRSYRPRHSVRRKSYRRSSRRGGR